MLVRQSMFYRLIIVTRILSLLSSTGVNLVTRMFQNHAKSDFPFEHLEWMGMEYLTWAPFLVIRDRKPSQLLLDSIVALTIMKSLAINNRACWWWWLPWLSDLYCLHLARAILRYISSFGSTRLLMRHPFVCAIYIVRSAHFLLCKSTLTYDGFLNRRLNNDIPG